MLWSILAANSNKSRHAESERKASLGLAEPSMKTDQERAREPSINGSINVGERMYKCTTCLVGCGIPAHYKQIETTTTNTSDMVSDSTQHMRNSSHFGEKLKEIVQRAESVSLW